MEPLWVRLRKLALDVDTHPEASRRVSGKPKRRRQQAGLEQNSSDHEPAGRCARVSHNCSLAM